MKLNVIYTKIYFVNPKLAMYYPLDFGKRSHLNVTKIALCVELFHLHFKAFEGFNSK